MASSVDISPTLGHGVLFTQAGVGTSPGYDAVDLRSIITCSGCGQEGVVEEDAWKVTERSGTPGMAVTVNADAGHALVQGDSVAFQDHYIVRPHSTDIALDLEPANVSNPRIDQVILEVLDDTHDGSTLNKARVRVLTGTPTSGATLDNRSGAAALPSNAIRLADVLVGAGDTSITNAEIRDRRRWARGAYRRIVRTSNAAGTDDYLTSSTSFVEVDAANLKPRIECSGKPLRIKLNGRARNNTANLIYFQPRIDGEAVDGVGDLFTAVTALADIEPSYVNLEWDFTPPAGSHLLSWAWKVNAGTGRLFAKNAPLQMIVEEIVRPNTSNE